MASKETEQSSSIDGCVNELDTLVNTVTETTPAVSTELSKLLSDLKEKPSMSTAFVHARSYITKCHELADYICDEEQYTIKAIEEGNVEEFKDYLEEVLSKSKGCHKDLQTLLEFIEREERHFNEEEDRLTRKNKALINTGIGIVAGMALGILGGILLGLYCDLGVLVVAGIVVGAVIGAMAKIIGFVKGEVMGTDLNVVVVGLAIVAFGAVIGGTVGVYLRSDVIELNVHLKTSRYDNEQTGLSAAILGAVIGGMVTTIGLYIGNAMKKLDPNNEMTIIASIGLGGVLGGAIVGGMVIGLQCDLQTTSLTAAVLGAIIGGLMGIIIHLKGDTQVSHQEILHEIQLHLYNIEKRLGGVNSRFKLTLDDYLVNKRFYYQHQGNKSSTIQAIRKVISKASYLKDHCQPLKDASTLEDFIALCYVMK